MARRFSSGLGLVWAGLLSLTAVAQGAPGAASPAPPSLTARGAGGETVRSPALTLRSLEVPPLIATPELPALRRLLAESGTATGPTVPVRADVPRWLTERTLRLIAQRRLDPPTAARSLALGLSAAHDAARLSHRAGADASLSALVAGTRVLMSLFPQDAPQLKAEFEGRLRAAPDAETGRRSWGLGGAVAAAVLDFAEKDGAREAALDTRAAGTPATGEGQWRPLRAQHPLEPGWGSVQPIGLRRDTLPQVAPPPRWSDEVFSLDRAAFRRVQSALAPAQLATAQRWAAGSGTVTPLGLWMEEALRLSEPLTGPETLTLLTLTAVSGHNAFISCWKAKFEYNVERPETWLAALEPGWRPPLETPPFPSYPSGHATVSGAAAQVLQFFFPAQAQRLRESAAEAALSRVYGGIHWGLDGAAGLDAGERVAAAVLAQAARSPEAAQSPVGAQPSQVPQAQSVSPARP